MVKFRVTLYNETSFIVDDLTSYHIENIKACDGIKDVKRVKNSS